MGSKNEPTNTLWDHIPPVPGGSALCEGFLHATEKRQCPNRMPVWGVFVVTQNHCEHCLAILAEMADTLPSSTAWIIAEEIRFQVGAHTP